MKKNLFYNLFCYFCLILLVSGRVFGHIILLPELKEEEFQVALDNLPMPVGGYETIMKKIVYPEMALKTRTEGKVYLMIYIDESGNVVEVKIVKGIGAGCEDEALRIVKRTKFVPAKSNGVIVKAKFAVSLSFKLPA